MAASSDATLIRRSGKEPLVEKSTVPVVSDVADAASKPYVRPALFMRPRAGAGTALPATPGDHGPVPAVPQGIKVEFKGWAVLPRRWAEWVAKLRRRHEPLWREVGILDGILASTHRVSHRDHEHALLQLATSWCEATCTFVFPWGEAMLTVEDVAVLAGLPLLGVSVREPVSDSLEKDVAAIEVVRAAMNRSKAKKASYSAWVKRFLEHTPEEEEEEEEKAPPSAARGGRSGGGGDGDADEQVEHGAFLSMWLSLFALPGHPFNVVRREVLPLAACLARGKRVALAPAALAAIHHDLSELKRRITSGKTNEPFVFSAPAHILQLWVCEHFTQLSPDPAPAASSAPGDHDRQLPSVPDDTTLRQQPDVSPHAATDQAYDGLLKGPTEEMHTCIVTGDINNTDKVPNENLGIFVSNQELKNPMEHSAGASRKKSRNTDPVSPEVCTKTLYYLSRFDRTKEAWEKDANTLPRRAVGTREMIQKASAIRQAEMAQLKIEIDNLKEEIRELEAAEKRKSHG